MMISFSAAKFAAPKETQLTGVTVYSREVNIFASSEGWYTPSGGSGSTIASNAWIKNDIPANSLVITATPEIKVKPKALPKR